MVRVHFHQIIFVPGPGINTRIVPLRVAAQPLLPITVHPFLTFHRIMNLTNTSSSTLPSSLTSALFFQFEQIAFDLSYEYRWLDVVDSGNVNEAVAET